MVTGTVRFEGTCSFDSNGDGWAIRYIRSKVHPYRIRGELVASVRSQHNVPYLERPLSQ